MNIKKFCIVPIINVKKICIIPQTEKFPVLWYYADFFYSFYWYYADSFEQSANEYSGVNWNTLQHQFNSTTRKSSFYNPLYLGLLQTANQSSKGQLQALTAAMKMVMKPPTRMTITLVEVMPLLLSLKFSQIHL